MTKAFRRKVLLVDLDGTLTDPAEGIVGCVRFALAAMGRAAAPDADLAWIIGPPLRQSFATMLDGTARAEEALAVYRTRYGSSGLFEAVVYDGATEALARLKQSGARLFLVHLEARRLREPHPRPLRAQRILRRGLRLRTRRAPRGQGRPHRSHSRRTGAGAGRLRHVGRPQARRRRREAARDSDHRRALGIRRRTRTPGGGGRGALRCAAGGSSRLRPLCSGRSP